MDDFPIEICEEMLRCADQDSLSFIRENRAPTIQEQDEVFQLYDDVGIVNGCVGSWNEEYINHMAQAIENSNTSNQEKYFLLESLLVGIENNFDHPIGDWSVYNQISRKIDKYI